MIEHLGILIDSLFFHSKMMLILKKNFLINIAWEIKDFNVLIDNKLFIDWPMKNKQEAYEKRIEMSRNDDYAIRNLLD